MEPISLREFAKRLGKSAMAVSRAIKTQRIKESVVYVDGSPKIRDPELALREWAANTSLDRHPEYAVVPAPVTAPVPAAVPETPDEDEEAPGDLTLADAARQEKYWKAKQAKLKYQQEAGELVPARDVEVRLRDVFSVCRVKLLGIPSRAKQGIPHLTVADVSVIEGFVREALEGLSEGAK